MTDCALDCLARAARPHERLSLGDATRRNVSQKGGVWISIRGSDWIFRYFDDAMADRLRATARDHKTMARCSADVSFRRRGGFDHLHPGHWLYCREIIGCLPHIFVGGDFCNGTHTIVIFPGSAFEIAHLTDDVLGGEAGDIGGFRMPLSRHQMAEPHAIFVVPVSSFTILGAA